MRSTRHRAGPLIKASHTVSCEHRLRQVAPGLLLEPGGGTEGGLSASQIPLHHALSWVSAFLEADGGNRVSISSFDPGSLAQEVCPVFTPHVYAIPFPAEAPS